MTAGVAGVAGVGPRAGLLSCDVFDTALVRRVGAPSAVFLILGTRLARKGLVCSTPEVFARARIEANRRARANAGRGMGLADIYLELQFALGLGDEEREATRREELALEAELLAPVPGAAERLRQARESGMTVAFLSDMYLSSAFLREQLVRHGMMVDGERCHVSCEAGCGKEDGRGFRLMAASEGVELERIVHRGNDPRADIAAARALGVATEAFYQGNLNRYEEVLGSHSYATGGFSSMIAGASRLARLSVVATNPRDVALRDVAASVAAPVLVGYALWVLLRARALGIRHLVFLPPSAPILAQVAEELGRRLGLGIGLSSLPSVPTEPAPVGTVAQDALGTRREPDLPAGPDWALVGGAMDDSFFVSLDGIPTAAREAGPPLFVFARSGEPGALPPTGSGPVHTYFADHSLPRGHRMPVDDLPFALFLRRELPLVHRTIASVTEHLWLDPESLDLEANLRPALDDLMASFLRSPSGAEADAWGAFAGGKGGSGRETPIASPFSLRHLPDAFGRGRLGGSPGFAWPEASLAITPPLTRGLLTTAVRLRDRLGRVGGKVRRVLGRG